MNSLRCPGDPARMNSHGGRSCTGERRARDLQRWMVGAIREDRVYPVPRPPYVVRLRESSNAQDEAP